MGKGKGTQPSGQTITTTNTSPWAPQQPYLQEIFSQAQNLYGGSGPQYYPDTTYQPANNTQWGALNNLTNLAPALSGQAAQVGGANTNLARGSYLNSNPAQSVFGSLSGSNPGLGIQGSSDVLNALATGQTFNNPGFTPLANFAGTNAGANTPGSGTLQDYASGKYLNAGNPYSSGLAQSVLASTVPSIQSQFINGGGLSGPNAAYATSQGATAALAPIAYNQYTQEQGLQQQAANTLGSQYLTGAGLQGQALNNLASQYNQARQMQANAASTLGQQSLAGTGLQLQGAAGLSDAWKSAMQNMIQGQALFPQTAQSELLGDQTAYGAGAQQQQLGQNAINDAIQRWNYGATLPYQQLNQYIAQVTGNYGGTSQSMNPYYINQGANALSGGLGGALLGSQLLGPAGFGATSSGLGAGLGGGLGLLLGISDRRLKSDIRRVGTLDNGLPVYVFRYYGDPEMRMGVMADEVELIHPDAVAELAGFKLVDYDKAVG